MKSHDLRRALLLCGAAVSLFVASGVVPACHLVTGIDNFSTDPSLDIPPPTPCSTESDCPGTDTECSLRACVANVCAPSVAARGTAVLEQIVGDCKSNQCDGAGNRVDGIIDATDVLADGKECTIDACSQMGEPMNEPAAAGTKCAMNTMVCDGKGACVECASDTDCAVDRICSMNHCVSKTCVNQMKDMDETDVDCGGPNCQACATGLMCLVNSDCQSTLCQVGKCSEPSCTDGQKNGDETDADCGGMCDPCADGLACLVGADCASKVCTTNLCAAATCNDAVQNGDEINVDCGGSCGGCPSGSACTTNANCGSEFCLAGICAKIVQVATGAVHACAVVEAKAGDGRLFCWGGNNYGELGVGAVGTNSPQPMNPVALENVTSVSTGSNTLTGVPGSHTCARYAPLNSPAKFTCWGRNDSGQLGNNSKTTSIQPVVIAFSANNEPVQIVAGGRHTCIITKTMHVQCWGANGNGQCGANNSVNTILTPQSVAGPNVPNPIGAVQLALGTIHSCVRLITGEVSCWGNNARGQVGIGNTTNQNYPNKLATITGVTQLATGQDFTCGLTNTNLFCWGDDSDGQLGPGAPNQLNPTLVQNIASLQTLPLTLGASGTDSIPDTAGGHSCFIVANGKLVCLGLNDHGQLGTGNTTNTSTATLVNTVEPVKQVALSTQFTCAILDKGALRCWGRNDLHQLGNGEIADSSLPVPVKWPNP